MDVLECRNAEGKMQIEIKYSLSSYCASHHFLYSRHFLYGHVIYLDYNFTRALNVEKLSIQ
jgi:hypothetical protein